MDFNQPTVLGWTGVRVGRLGIASGMWAPAPAIEEAFERGCNYFTWGTVIRGFSPHMRDAMRNIVAKGRRDKLFLSMFTYAHMPFWTERLFLRGLKSAGLDHADALILGYFSRRPPKRVVAGALRMKAKGLVRFIGISSHKRTLFPALAKEGVFDIFHVRYNAANPGAETEVFPLVGGKDRPGIVTFTATKWGRLLNPKKMPPNEAPLTAADCYRFVLSNPAVDVCMTGAKTLDQMRQNLKVLDMGPLDAKEMERVRRIGEFVHGPSKSGRKY
jgi:predicted aldo/keto reductase-like oxidoreductase